MDFAKELVKDYYSYLTILLAALNVIVLALTLKSIVRYTRETSRMREETVKQNELTIRPLILLRRGDGDHSAMRLGLILDNIGNGPALEITMGKTEIHDRRGELDELTFSRIDIINEKEKVPAPNCDPSIAFDAVASLEEHDYKIRYHDLNMKEYFTVGKIGKNAISFSRTGAS